MKKSEAEAIAREEFGEDVKMLDNEPLYSFCPHCKKCITSKRKVKVITIPRIVYGQGSSWEVALKRARQNFKES